MKTLPVVLLIGFEALFTNIWPPLPEQEPPPPPVEKTLAAAREADCTRDTREGNIFGETAQVRGERSLPPMTAELARAVAAARIAQDVKTARSILAPFLGDGTTTTNHLARLQLAYAILRLVPTDPTIEAATTRALLQPETAFATYSDAHYIRAALAYAEGRGEEALRFANLALRINPKYYNAAMLRAILLLREADESFRSDHNCMPLVDALISAVVPISNLGACPLQLAHFRLAVDRALPRSTGLRRKEMMRILDIALAYAARKDTLHSNLLASYADQPDSSICRQELQRHDFGTALD